MATGEFHSSTGIKPTTVRRSYATYRSPYGPKYTLNTNVHGWTIKNTTKLGLTLAGFGGAAGVFAIFFFSDIPKVRNDIMRKIPFIGSHFVREIPPSDNHSDALMSCKLQVAKLQVYHSEQDCYSAWLAPQQRTRHVTSPHSTHAIKSQPPAPIYRITNSCDSLNPLLSLQKGTSGQNLRSYEVRRISATMAGPEVAPDPQKALQCKEEGNRYFQHGDYTNAEALYTKAINYDPSNPLLYTNRAMALLKLSHWEPVIADSLRAITLHPENMKAYYYLAQAQIALHHSEEALKSARSAHSYCIRELVEGKKGGGSLGVITELVLKYTGEIRKEYDTKIDDLRHTFDIAGKVDEESRRRKVPDWCVDNITFSVMVDPVVTKTGSSYDRSSIMEHLKRSPTDPLTREPLRAEDLRPNLALRQACEEFLDENGWAVDW
ncbi:hypothetical protein G7Y89_g8922 [Cudoniella acicularis]|uniref:U-box domain-containing protein n=1 Tax=Cudoniella acicularis TaxID=354080 RepID=A0A8H4RIA2_9HELO|nr:hypothetical protein G7Y89_g8922 [Cudoniella acicularis]